MRIEIENFAKIKYANILIDGITVIAGENNTGKSTIGKVLYSTFNSLYDIDMNIERRRIEEIQDICGRSMRNAVAHAARKGSINDNTRNLSNKISAEFVDKLLSTDAPMLDEIMYVELLKDSFAQYGILPDEEEIREYVEATYEKVLFRKQNDNHKIALEVIYRFFHQIFGNQIQCLKFPKEETKISLNIKGKDLQIRFRDNKCVSWEREYDILHEAFLLDDPFVLDEMSDFDYLFGLDNGIRKQMAKRLDEADNDIMQGLFDAVSAKENLEEIYSILDNVVVGSVSQKNGHWGLNEEEYDEPIQFENLSAGLKSFVELKMLLEEGIIKEKDVLILDEPEIHLHPEWQLIYAQIIVLLQKKFDLSIVVTTHSRDFLEAIELYSKKYGISTKCNYYLSKEEDGVATFEDVTDSLDKIYMKLVTPGMLLDKLRYEMEDTEDEEF